MVRRLVLGCGAVGHAVIDGLLADRGELVVLEADEGRVEALRDENIPADLADPTDAAVVRRVADGVETVLVLGDDSVANRAAAAVAREVHPDAFILAYTGRAPDPADRSALSAAADQLVDHGSAVAQYLRRLADTEPGAVLYGLQRTLRSIDGTLGVYTHDNPDPDAIASAVALRELAAAVGVDAEVCYFGEISHQENRAFVNLLELELTQLDAEEFDPERHDAYALVDHTRPGVNDQLPPDLPVDIVIDHHPQREPVDVRFEDRRPALGATSTMLADYYRWLGIVPGTTIATALLYGIRVDTRNFGRELAEADVEAAAYLLEWADQDLLDQIESPSVTADTLDTIARAIKHRVRAGSVLASSVGRIHDRDALAQAADELLTMDGVTTTLVFGFLEGTVYASARTRGTDVDIGETLRQAYGQIGSAGGHVDMAGAQLPMGILGEVESGDAVESAEAAIEETLLERFFEVLGVEPDGPVGADRPSPAAVLDGWADDEA
ncbi:MAG: DHH family phosphoesterase [Halobacteriales archaeon]|nr:DHH family phosphoesterase [Halobacteriales archaeon]